MTELVTKADLARMREITPHLDVRPLTSAEQRVVLGVCRGLSVTQACNAAGLKASDVTRLRQDEAFLTVCDYMKEVKYGYEQRELVVTRDMLNKMLFESHRKAESAMEEISAVRELGKMNDLYLNERRKAGVEININPEKITNEKQLERLDDAALIELTGEDFRLESESPIEDRDSA